MIHELVFSIPNIGKMKVNFKISFGSVERLYVATQRTSDKNYFSSISERIHIVSMDGGYYPLEWDRLIKIKLKEEILCEVLEIKERHDGNYIQVSEFNWIP
jgi:hypothetical protein